jgi:hypothetical protein
MPCARVSHLIPHVERSFFRGFPKFFPRRPTGLVSFATPPRLGVTQPTHT